MSTPSAILILDTSVLVNFLAIDRASLLSQLKTPVLITDHVVAEITQHYPAQLQRLHAAIGAGILKEIQLTSIPELEEFAKLSSPKPSRRKTLGDGECSAIAAAVHRGYVVGIDDRAAIKLVRAQYPQIAIRQTFEIVTDLIIGGALTVEDADGMKNDWATKHSFALVQFQSFRELLPP